MIPFRLETKIGNLPSSMHWFAWELVASLAAGNKLIHNVDDVMSYTLHPTFALETKIGM